MAQLYDMTDILKMLFPLVPGDYEKAQKKLEDMNLWCNECAYPNMMCSHVEWVSDSDYCDPCGGPNCACDANGPEEA